MSIQTQEKCYQDVPSCRNTQGKMKMLKGKQVAATLDRLTSRRGSWEAGGHSQVRNLGEMLQSKQQENVKEKKKKKRCLRCGNMYRPRQHPAFRNKHNHFARVFSPEQQEQKRTSHDSLLRRAENDKVCRDRQDLSAGQPRPSEKQTSSRAHQASFQGTERAATWRSTARGLCEKC